MTVEWRRLEWRPLVLIALAVAAVSGLTFGGLEAGRNGSARPEHPRPTSSPREELLSQRLAATDVAIEHKELRRAIQQWRGAYGVALGSSRWQAMADIGDAAVRIDGLASRAPGYLAGFRAEARQAYLRALFLARRDRSQEGADRVADAFAALGDAEAAARARSVLRPR